MSFKKLLNTGKKSNITDSVGDMIEKISTITASRQYSDEKLGKLVFATESISESNSTSLESVYNGIESQVKEICSDLGIAAEAFQFEAASIAGVIGTAPGVAMSSKLRGFDISNSKVMPAGVIDGFSERPQLSTEAYDERENRNAQTYSIVYNFLASRQDDFGETFFPTIIVNPNEVGLALSVKLFYVYNDFKRSIDGSLANYGRKSIIRAYANADILKNELTRVVPVLRTGGGADDNTDKFVSTTDVPSWSVNLGMNIQVPTGALKVDQKVDIMGLSQNNELLNSGLMGPSDTLDTYNKLESVFVKVTDGTKTNFIRLAVDHLPASTFTYAPQGNNRRMILTMDTDSLVLDSKTVTVNGTAPDALPELSTHKIRVQLTVNGNIVLDKGDYSITGGSLNLTAMRNAAGQLVTGAVFDTLAAKLANAEIVGYYPLSFRANSNIRQRGQLVDSQIENLVVNIPWRSPLSVIMPSVNMGGDDNSTLHTLITTNGIRVSNEAVTALLKTEVELMSYNGVADANGELPELAAVGHYYIKPMLLTEPVNMAETVDSIKSHEKLKDIRAALVEKLRFHANELYRGSEYKAAAAVLTGNVGFKPTVVVGTDPFIYNYLMSDGELRTLGDTFDLKIVSSLDTRMAGKIYISFGVFDGQRNTSINPLNFGNMLYSPEVPTVMPVSRDGQVSKELIVTPRFVHVNNLPVLSVLTVTNMPQVINKVAVNFNQV